MQKRSIVIAGLPESGKTTFLAALWHLVVERRSETQLRLDSLLDGEKAHLNKIAARWREGKAQVRTESGQDRVVSMSLLDQTSNKFRLTFPDVCGESFREIWEERQCSVSLADMLRGCDSLLLFVNADKYQRHLLTVETTAQSKKSKMPLPSNTKVEWNPRLSPTQVQVVDLLQLFRTAPISANVTKLALVLSLWDKVAEEKRSPRDFLRERFPLLHQYLTAQGEAWNWATFGVSAQGGDYIRDDVKPTDAQLRQVAKLKKLDVPSKRITVISDQTTSHDLTEPIKWLLE